MSTYPPQEPPAAYIGDGNGHNSDDLGEKGYGKDSPVNEPSGHEYDVQESGQRPLMRSLKGRHMQMIAIGTSAHTSRRNERQLD